MSRLERSDLRYADTFAWIASRTAGSMSSTRRGTAKKRLIDTTRPLAAGQAEVDGDRDALARAAIGTDAVREPAREDDAHAGSRRKALRLAEGRSVRAGKRQVRRVHDRCHATRILYLELTAERAVGADSAVVDIIRGGPQGAGMRVELVAVPLAVDVRPRVDAPSDLVPLPAAVDRDLIDDGLDETKHCVHRRAAPFVQVPARLPAAMVRTLHRLVGRFAGEDDALELGIQLIRAGHGRDHERRREEIEQRQLRRVAACGSLRPA